MQTGPECIVVGSPGDERIERFQAAVHRRGWSPATVVSYRELSEHGAAPITRHLRPGTLVRIESPGSSFESFAALVRRGGSDEPLVFERGRLRHVRAWYLGLCRVLQDIAPVLPAGRTLGNPSDIACMFDKRRCHGLLESHAVPVPPALPAPASFEGLLDTMRAHAMTRVFFKLAHGSSASGVVALHADARGIHALTTVERVGSKLYNSKRLLFYRDVRALAAIYEALAREGLHIEAWLPKIGLDNRPVDLRILVIAGRARHVVARAGHGPITNLHIGARRADPERLRIKMGDLAWARALATAEKAAKVFPSSLAVGVDLLVEPDPRRIAVLEMNAFGDLLRGAVHEGEDPYDAQLTEMAPCSI